ncbi:hypothetical protein PZA11_002174 [Diplocarpon coronariae]|nr:G-protein coupled receptor [Diplocarpon mali]
MWIHEIPEFHLNNISIIERFFSTLSLIGAAFTITTFLFSRLFHKPINRVIFYASAGNVFTNIGTIISRGALDSVDVDHGMLCQFQGVLIQTFLPADALWTFVMALNVYLTFYHRFDARQLRKLEKYYLLVCYGVPLIPGITLVLVSLPGRGRPYANAILWCWLSSAYDQWRVYFLYAPVWSVSLATVAIYLRLGFTIYYKKLDLDRLNEPNSRSLCVINDPFIATRTTEVTLTSEAIPSRSNSVILQRMRTAPPFLATSVPGQASGQGICALPVYSGAQSSYKCEVTVGEVEPKAHVSAKARALPQIPDRIIFTEASSSTKHYRDRSSLNIQVPEPMTPSNRKKLSTGSNTLVTDPQTPTTPNLRYNNTRVAKKALYAWVKVSLMFVGVMAVTWIPSSANRLYTVYHPGQVLPVLLYLAAIVIPLQGFWNAVIYIYTSWDAVKDLWADMKSMFTAEDQSWRVPTICELVQMVKGAWDAIKEAFAPEEELIVLPMWRRRCRSLPLTPVPARQNDDTESTVGLRDDSWPVAAEI